MSTPTPKCMYCRRELTLENTNPGSRACASCERFATGMDPHLVDEASRKAETSFRQGLLHGAAAYATYPDAVAAGAIARYNEFSRGLPEWVVEQVNPHDAVRAAKADSMAVLPSPTEAEPATYIEHVEHSAEPDVEPSEEEWLNS